MFIYNIIFIRGVLRKSYFNSWSKISKISLSYISQFTSFSIVYSLIIISQNRVAFHVLVFVISKYVFVISKLCLVVKLYYNSAG